MLAASFSTLALAAFLIGGVGACAGTTYVTGFTVLQESVSDELRGRTFATLYTVVRLCLLISLTVSPLFADFWDWVTRALLDNQAITVGPYSYALPGVRIALWCGGHHHAGRRGLRVALDPARRDTRPQAEGGEAAAMVERIEHGPEAPFVAPGLVEPTVPVEDEALSRRPPARRRTEPRRSRSTIRPPKSATGASSRAADRDCRRGDDEQDGGR